MPGLRQVFRSELSNRLSAFALAFRSLNPEARSQEPLSNSFRRPQFRAASPRVTIAFLFGCGYRFFRQNPVVRVLIRALAEGILYDAVFQRVKANHYDSSTWFQNLRRCGKQRLQIVQFAVYEDSKSLKSSCRGMNSAFSLIHWPGRG